MMTENEKRATRRVPVALRIRLRYQAIDQFISKFAINISRGGMFLSSRNPKPPGTELYFEIRLADESPVIEGTGRVRWIREYNRRRPEEPHGMGIQFRELSDASWQVLDRILDHRRKMGERDESSIPEPRGMSASGLDAAVPPEMAESGAGIADVEDRGAGHADRERDERSPGDPSPAAARQGRRTPTGRPESNSDQTVPPVTDPLLIRAALARARTLAGAAREGGDLDRELAELLEESAAPIEVTVDAASRELAERLGGEPVARRPPSSPGLPSARSARSGSSMSIHEGLEEMDGTGDVPRRAMPVPDGEPSIGGPSSAQLDASGEDGRSTSKLWLLDGLSRDES